MGKNITKNWDVKKKYLTPVSLIKSSLADGSRLSGGHRITDTGMRISLLGLFIANVVSLARLSRKSQQEPSSMGLLGEALFSFLGEFRNASQASPDRFVASPDKPDGACVFLMRGCLGIGKGSFGKAFRGSRGTRHDRLGREKIVVSGTDGSVRRHSGPSRS